MTEKFEEWAAALSRRVYECRSICTCGGCLTSLRRDFLFQDDSLISPKHRNGQSQNSAHSIAVLFPVGGSGNGMATRPQNSSGAWKQHPGGMPQHGERSSRTEGHGHRDLVWSLSDNTYCTDAHWVFFCLGRLWGLGQDRRDLLDGRDTSW